MSGNEVLINGGNEHGFKQVRSQTVRAVVWNVL